METEDQGSLPFLDVRITKATDGHLTHQVYRKPTHTDRYLHYRSFHHPSVLQSVSSTLVKRAHDLSDKQHLQQELQHIKSTLTTINGYPSGKIKVRPPKPQPTTPALIRVTIPYMGKTSHKLQRILKTVNIEVRHRSSNKLHSSLHTHKDRKHKNTQPGVYKILCECGKVYIGETGRSFNTRIKEHNACQRLGDGDKSAIVKHTQQQQHKIHWEDGSIITSIPHWHTRRVREAIEILQHNTVPQDSGLHINDIWHPLLQKTQDLLHPGPQPAQHQVASLTSASNTQVIHTPVIQSFS